SLKRILILDGSTYSNENLVVPSAQNLPWRTKGFTIRLEVRVSVMFPHMLVYFFCASWIPFQTWFSRSSDWLANTRGKITNASTAQSSRRNKPGAEPAFLSSATLTASLVLVGT